MSLKTITDAKRWDEFVLASQNYTHLQAWEFGEFMESRGYQVYRFIDELANLGAQVLIIKARRGKIMQLRHAPLFQQSFLDLDPTSQIEQLSSFLGLLQVFALRESCDFIRMQPLIEIDSKLANIYTQVVNDKWNNAQIHNIDAVKTLILDITPEPEQLLTQMRKQTRYYIRQADKKGVQVRISKEADAIEKFYKIHADTVIRQDFNSFELEYYQAMWEAVRQPAQSQDQLLPGNLTGEIFIAEYEGVDIAAAIILYFGDKAFYSDGGSLSKYSKIPGSYAIQWQAIQTAKSRGLSSYNFWGGVSADKNNKKYPWHGIDQFKRGFGGDRIEYMHTQDLALNFKYQLIRAYEWWEKTRRGY